MRIDQNIQVNGDFKLVVLLAEVIDEKPRAGINQGASDGYRWGALRAARIPRKNARI